MDLGLKAAGWRTVSFSEIDPYASAVLVERWPDVPNLGDIGALRDGPDPSGRTAEGHQSGATAVLWTGGFPCQDLSVAGKRAGLAGDRSGLAFTFLGLLERHRPPACILENVPGLLSSHGGRDMARLLGELADIGYGVAYRVLDAQFCGVPQRRRRVFILGLRCGDDDPDGRAAAERAAEVLAVGTRCQRDHQAEREARTEPTRRAGYRSAWAVRQGHQGANGWGVNHDYAHTLASDAASQAIVDGPPPDPDRMRAADGLARRLDGGAGVAQALRGGQRGLDFSHAAAGQVVVTTDGAGPDLDPLGLDSHRYRCAGNGVAAPVAEWIGMRLRRYFEGTL